MEPPKSIRLAMAMFDSLIRPDELPFFRGAMIRVADGDAWFHNHLDSGYRYRYPLIQYKLFDGHPAILGMDEGAAALRRHFFPGQEIHCRIGNRSRVLKVSSIGEWEEETGLSEEMRSYAIEDWLPLNSRNFREYVETDAQLERNALLQRVLVGNILSFAKGMGLYFDREVKCDILRISSDTSLSYKGIDLMGFSAVFMTNALLPQWIGLGKSASQNHGTVIHLNT